MLELIARWRERRWYRIRLRQADAHKLLSLNPTTAYYDAQRLAARARFAGDSTQFVHWVQVAVEVARISDNPMDTGAIEEIIAEEERRANAAAGLMSEK